ncbi:MAG TPA: MBL fold metallo-hydrolase, partial [Frankiaceae bacterium]|nr:MBL fold metallo-hydrolase [Frankiaceae bacterium]
MKVQLLGTGSADGWPNPWCGCASCTWARGAGQARTHTAALVDDVLLLDCGPDVPKTAARLGVSLAGVRHLLLGHAHPDHTGPEALMWRGWSTVRARPLDVVGPPAALAACRHWVGPDDPVRFVEVQAGDRLPVGRYQVRVLPAAHGDATVGPAVLYDLMGPDGRLLYATDTAPPPAAALDAAAGAGYDVVLLEETHGDRGGPGDHLDLASFAATCAELRRRGAVTERTRVVAVHLGHGNPPGPELARRLGLLGAELLAEGDVVGAGPPPPRAR